MDWSQSPRLITVAAPEVELDVQDLYDTLRVLEAASPNLDDDPIVEAGGKEALSVGVKVGLTVKLLNAKIAFEARPGPAWVLVKISGGNCVAVDANGADMDVRQPTAYVTADRVASSSATLVSGGASAGEVADAVLDEMLTGHLAADSVGEALALMRGLGQQNFVLDSTSYNTAGLMLAGRIRIFATAAAALSATQGGTGEGELASFTVTSVAVNGSNRAAFYRVTRA